MQRNSVTRRIERELYDLLQWNNPVRSGAVLGLIVGSILLTRSYSLLQMGSALLTVAIGLNLVYVTFVVQTQKVFTESTEALHPYRGMIGNKDQMTTVDKRAVQHYSSLFVDIAETVIRALARIVFIEDTMTSVKWFAIFYLTWAISAHVSSRVIVLFFVISAFIFPRLYLSNKGIVDSHLMQGEALLKDHINTAQVYARENMGSAMAKTKAYFAKAGTTDSEAKNSINETSVAEKKTE
ncbi:Reticulon-domain-containing protein [Fennellomyces sp. T-0311]|nr:Reticulon-domain-containing protein [Fennellomyces sp. T-0311]